MDAIEWFLNSAVRELLNKILRKKAVPYTFYENLSPLEPDDLAAVLDALVNEGRLSDAEDLLFSQYEKQPSKELYEVAQETFWQMEQLSDERLTECNYSRAEIAKARKDF